MPPLVFTLHGFAQSTALPDESLVTETVPGTDAPLPDDAVIYLVFRTGGESFEPVTAEDTNLPGE